MDQPNIEVRKLETVLAAYGRWEELESKKSAAKTRNRQRHQPTVIKQEMN